MTTIRAVPVPPGIAGRGATADGGASDLPSAHLLATAKELSRRFPTAGLQPVKLTRVEALDGLADPNGRVRVHLADESAQVTGSFKVRGALLALANVGGRPVVAASAGNHGAGVAYAAKVLGVDAVVVVPRAAPATKRAKIESYGARIVLGPTDHYDDAEVLAQRLAREEGRVFISPYDDPAVAAGNGASVGYEITEALGHAPWRLLAPQGGGGLVTGLGCALRDVAPGRRVWGAQSRVSPAMALSLQQGAAVERLISSSPTLAEGLEGGISAAAFRRACGVVAGVLVVDEAPIARAMIYARDTLGVHLEGSAAVALAPVLEGLPAEVFASAGDALDAPWDLVVLLTGSNVDEATWIAAQALTEGAGAP